MENLHSITSRKHLIKGKIQTKITSVTWDIKIEEVNDVEFNKNIDEDEDIGK